MRRLVAGAQVFMCNLLVKRQEKFGLDPQTLFAVKPDLVHATLTGYGTTHIIITIFRKGNNNYSILGLTV